MPTFSNAETQVVYNRVPNVTFDFWLIKRYFDQQEGH